MVNQQEARLRRREYSCASLVGLGPVATADKWRRSQRGSQFENVDAQRADENQLSGTLPTIRNVCYFSTSIHIGARKWTRCWHTNEWLTEYCYIAYNNIFMRGEIFFYTTNKKSDDNVGEIVIWSVAVGFKWRVWCLFIPFKSPLYYFYVVLSVLYRYCGCIASVGNICLDPPPSPSPQAVMTF